MKRQSLRLIALLACIVMGLSVLAGCADSAQPVVDAPAASAEPSTMPETTPAATPKNNDWDYEYDVVVVGFGGAGAVSAITAADAGASVLLLEKAGEGGQGGNTRVSGQQILTPNDEDKATQYLIDIQEGFDTDETLIRTMVAKMMENEQWLVDMGATGIEYISYLEYPEVEGADSMTCILLEKTYSTGLFWNVLDRNVGERDIDVWFSSPGKELVQDPETGVILGVIAEQNGQQIKVKANNGVILACGGFENNQEMIQSYLHLPYGYPKGTYLNTGDGIIMAAKVGAQMWHMNNPAGPDLNFKDPDSTAYFGYNLNRLIAANPAIIVGSEGTRFWNEAYSTRHGKVPFHGNYITLPVSLPAYMIFDETMFAAGAIYSGGGWSSDNTKEVEKGWIKKADTLEELAGMIGLEGAALSNTVAEYNAACKAGEDKIFNRPAETLFVIDNGPYYAMELSPTFTNTQGGPKRNEKCEVLDYSNDPIPNLYSAGELGSMYGHGYNGGGNVGEVVASGRIAGENAAQPKGNTGETGVAGKGGDMSGIAQTTAATAQNAFKAGTYTGEGTGMGGTIRVEVEVDDTSIKSIKILEHGETAGISDNAREKMPESILAAQTVEVDDIAGATMTSKGIRDAVAKALEQAK